MVYQAHGRGLDEEFARVGNSFATGGLTPDLTILFDLDPHVGLSRLESKDRMDGQSIEFHLKVRAGFLYEARLNPMRWRLVDASQSQEAVLEECWEIITPHIQSNI